MYFRVDPSRSAGNDLFVIEMNADYNALKQNVQVACMPEHHYNLPTAILLEGQTVTCIETASKIYTLIYKI